ncbi:MAG: 30S ribosomal protein S20 [Candidatus Omnitrophica bacterium]|nr:30S ribosomal protein S20 [Candidatus Omnitrophota bacterium]
MPQRKCAIKTLRKNSQKHAHNLDIKTDLKKTIKKFLSAVAQKNKDEAQTSLQGIYKKLDKAVKRNILHKNTVARRKSRFARAFTEVAKA